MTYLLQSLGIQATQRLSRPILSRCTISLRNYQTALERRIPSDEGPRANLGTWSRDQNPKAQAMMGPRFEQTAMSAQPTPSPAIDLIHQQPIQIVSARVASCDGGGGALGHPKIFINLDRPGPHVCGYCGLRFERVPDDH